MRQYTIQHTVYTFDELSPEAQQKAIDDLRDINTDYDFYNYSDTYTDIASEYGICLYTSDLCFDLYRNTWLYIDNHDHARSGKTSYIDDMTKYLKKAGIDLRTKDARTLLDNGFTLDTKHYGGGDGRSFINTDYCNISDDTEQKLQETIDELCNKIEHALKKEYEYLISDEAIKETIISNEYEFYIDGKIA